MKKILSILLVSFLISCSSSNIEITSSSLDYQEFILGEWKLKNLKSSTYIKYFYQDPIYGDIDSGTVTYFGGYGEENINIEDLENYERIFTFKFDNTYDDLNNNDVVYSNFYSIDGSIININPCGNIFNIDILNQENLILSGIYDSSDSRSCSMYPYDLWGNFVRNDTLFSHEGYVEYRFEKIIN